MLASVTTSVLRRMASTPASNTRAMSAVASQLRERLDELVPGQREKVKQLLADHGDTVVDSVKVEQIIGGGRGIKFMVWDGSNLDANEGIRFRGKTIPEVQKLFPGTESGGQPKPESLLWLLLTGEIPTAEQEASVTKELHERSEVPDSVKQTIANFPRDMHPMTQLCSAVLAMQSGSVFAKDYFGGTHKMELWKSAFEDTMNLIAKLPTVAALIYRNTFHDGAMPDNDTNLDYSANFARLLGFNNRDFDELMRLYLTIHTDHEGGNASAHTTHLVGSTLSDPYYSYAAGMCSLAGPLHGLANQEVLRFVKHMQSSILAKGQEVNPDSIREFAWEVLNGGKVVPGFGHAVLRITDPRYSCQREFAAKYLADDPLVKVVMDCYEVIPEVLTEHGKTKNPWPNVDAHSGVLLVHYGLTEENYYTVLFGVSRAIGVLSQLVWDRALGLPLERPKSLTLDGIRDIAEASK